MNTPLSLSGFTTMVSSLPNKRKSLKKSLSLLIAACLLLTLPLASLAQTITGSTPARNANAAAITTNVSLTSTAPFAGGAASAIKVFSSQAGGKKLGTATVSGNTLTFDPAADFKPGETVFTTLTSASGLAKPHVFSFTTAAARASGTFSNATDVAVGADPLSVAAADVDGDGDVDILTANVASNTVSVRLNDGKGAFSNTTDVPVGAFPNSVAAADIDGDGDLDILCSNRYSNTVSVLLNNGDGTFSDAMHVSVGNSPNSVAAADVDGDGDLDILTANYNGSNVSVRLNDGKGAFSNATDVPVGNGPFSVAAADVDGDGDVDVLTANIHDYKVSVRLNDGSGSFTVATDVTVDVWTRSVAAADVDGDGDLDILAINQNDHTVSVLLNDGKGAFSNATDVPVGDSPFSVAAADVDGDGDLDILTANPSSDNVSVLLNGPIITLSDINKADEKEDLAVSFSSSDFTNAVSNGSLSKVKITSLPDASTGMLKLGVDHVTVDQEILLADLATLTFVPAADYNGSASFKWNGTQGSVYAETDATVTITLTAVNDAPSFTKGADQIVNEDAALQAVGGWATAILPGPANESAQTIDFIVNTNNSSLFSLQPTISADGTLTYRLAANAFGVAIVSVQVKDNGGTALGGIDASTIQTFTITVTAVNDATLVLATPASQQVQYSDLIAPVAISASDVDNTPADLTAAASWKLASASTFTSGLPTALAFTQTSAGNWTLSGRAMMAPGTYIVRVTVNDGTTDASTNSGYMDIEIVVLPEDARVTYTGALFASTSSATSSTAKVTLSATIQDITARTGDPAYDGFAGDIKNATLAFKIVETGETLFAPIGYVNSSDKKIGTATTTWNVDIGSFDSKQYTVQLIIGDHYVGPLTPAYEVVTVSKPLNDFVTGGGYIILSNSAGQKAGNAGSKNNFGFNIKYNKKGTNLQGNINTIFRRTESDDEVHVYQIKGNAMTSLSVKASTSTTGQAVFNGKASIQDITNPLAPLSVDGNATLQVNMTDMGEPGSSDKIAITVWNKDGGLWFASSWDGVRTVEKTLAGGNLIIRGASTARMDFDDSIQTEPSAEVNAYPNPVVDKVTIDLKGMAAIEAKIILTDAVGKAVLENAHKVVGESLLEIDMSGLRSGMYIIGLRTKAGYQVVKVIKQ